MRHAWLTAAVVAGASAMAWAPEVLALGADVVRYALDTYALVAFDGETFGRLCY